MDAKERVTEVFDRLVKLGPKQREQTPRAEQMLFYIVAASCEIDIDGFSSVFEQFLREKELGLLVEGLRTIREEELAAQFHQGLKLLKAERFYDHLVWNRVSDGVRRQIESIGDEVGDRLWKLDQKLAALVDDEQPRDPKHKMRP